MHNLDFNNLSYSDGLELVNQVQKSEFIKEAAPIRERINSILQNIGNRGGSILQNLRSHSNTAVSNLRGSSGIIDNAIRVLENEPEAVKTVLAVGGVGAVIGGIRALSKDRRHRRILRDTLSGAFLGGLGGLGLHTAITLLPKTQGLRYNTGPQTPPDNMLPKPPPDGYTSGAVDNVWNWWKGRGKEEAARGSAVKALGLPLDVSTEQSKALGDEPYALWNIMERLGGRGPQTETSAPVSPHTQLVPATAASSVLARMFGVKLKDFRDWRKFVDALRPAGGAPFQAPGPGSSSIVHGNINLLRDALHGSPGYPNVDKLAKLVFSPSDANQLAKLETMLKIPADKTALARITKSIKALSAKRDAANWLIRTKGRSMGGLGFRNPAGPHAAYKTVGAAPLSSSLGSKILSGGAQTAIAGLPYFVDAVANAQARKELGRAYAIEEQGFPLYARDAINTFLSIHPDQRIHDKLGPRQAWFLQKLVEGGNPNFLNNPMYQGIIDANAAGAFDTIESAP